MPPHDEPAAPQDALSPLPLQRITVVALQQAVAAPFATRQLADLGAPVIKIERAAGDFARGYDETVKGISSYFAWLNRGNESVTLDIKAAHDRALLDRLLAQADVFVQNLAPGAVHSANLDPDLFPEPLKVDFERLRNPHISFGSGWHRCLQGADCWRQ